MLDREGRPTKVVKFASDITEAKLRAAEFKGKVTALSKEPDGYRVSVEVSATNQKGDTTAAGTGACIVPSILMPAEE